VIERLTYALRTAYSDMNGFPRAPLIDMQAADEAWPDSEFVQGVLAQFLVAKK